MCSAIKVTVRDPHPKSAVHQVAYCLPKGQCSGTPASIRAAHAAFSAQASTPPSLLTTCDQSRWYHQNTIMHGGTCPWLAQCARSHAKCNTPANTPAARWRACSVATTTGRRMPPPSAGRSSRAISPRCLHAYAECRFPSGIDNGDGMQPCEVGPCAACGIA